MTDILYAIVYFPIDESFAIVDEVAVRGVNIHNITLDHKGKIVCDAYYDGKVYNAVIIQIGAMREQLQETLKYVRECKYTKKKSISAILEMIPIWREPSRRGRLQNLKVRFYFFECSKY
jgi:hypothetical protein